MLAKNSKLFQLNLLQKITIPLVFNFKLLANFNKVEIEQAIVRWNEHIKDITDFLNAQHYENPKILIDDNIIVIDVMCSGIKYYKIYGVTQKEMRRRIYKYLNFTKNKVPYSKLKDDSSSWDD